MTPVFCCGFECGQLSGHYLSVSNAAISTSTKRSGDRSLEIITSSTVGYVNRAFGASINTAVFRFYVRFSSLPSSDCRIINVDITALGSGAEIFFQSSDNSLYTGYDSGAEKGSTGIVVTTGIWYLIDFRINRSANPWIIEGKVDGVSLGTLTRAVAASTFSQYSIGILNSTTGTAYFDDLVVSQTSADYPIGAGYVNHFVPTSDGTHNIAGAADFRRGGTTTDILNATTTAYQLVDDVPLDDVTPDTNDHIRIVAPPNATDYVECVYGPAPGISTPTVAPRAVEVIAEFFAAGTGLSDEILKLNDNGTVDNVWNGTAVAGTTTGVYKRKHYATAPTGGAWTVVSGAGNFNNIRFRYGYANDANPDKSLMCTMIEAEFQEIAAIPNKIIQVKQSINRSNSF